MAINYPIEFCYQGIEPLESFFLQQQDKKIVLLVDENTEQFCLQWLDRFSSVFFEAELLKINPGENQKDIGVAQSLWTAMLDIGIDRNAILVNLGGGVVTDLGGFVASIYKRGIDFVNIPTTLIGQLDAAIGSKVGVNFNGYKNQLGGFFDPMAVFIVPDFLSTLSSKELLCGHAEALKHALLHSAALWDKVKIVHPEDWQENHQLMREIIQVKMEVVEKDRLDLGPRKKLNFGHSMGHAFESYMNKNGNPISHGHAVALGMICELHISKEFCGLPTGQFDEVVQVLKTLYQKCEIVEEEEKEVIDFLNQDKKNTDGVWNFTLLKGIGEAVIDSYPSRDMVRESLSFYRQMQF